jgi:hypothetical protein
MSSGTVSGVPAKSAPQETPLRTGFQEVAQSDAATLQSTIPHQVAVYTGDVPGAGTDGDVWLWVDGTAGSTGWRYIDNADDNFERNKTDYFYLNLPNIGTPVAAWVYYAPGGDWYLSWVSFDGRYFSHYNWLSKKGTVSLTPS